MASFKTVTDLDLLEDLGFDREEAKKALAITRGDVNQAKRILNGSLKEGAASTAWRDEYKGDFEAGIAGSKQSLGAENRALVKTPIYCSVGDAVVRDGITFYNVNTIIKNGRRYSRLRRYSQFSALKSALPLGTCSSFKSVFPMKGMTALDSMFGDLLGQKEQRRAALDEWLREMTLDETCMNSEDVTAVLYHFLGFDKEKNDAIPENEDPLSIGGGTMNQFAFLNNPSSGEGDSDEKIKTSSRVEPSSRPATMKTEGTAPLVFASESEKATASLKNFSMVPKLDPNPCFVQDMPARLPFKTAISKTALDHLKSDGNTNGDNTLAQLAKDFKRDRLIVNMKRISGSDMSIERIIETITGTINEVLAGENRPPLATTSGSFCEKLLQQVSRTSSAYLAHLTFSSIIKQDPERPITVVPASTLAEPLKVVISLRRKDPGASSEVYCIQCELEGSTVFRINDPLTDDLDTLLQVKCTYRKTLFGMPRERKENGESRVELDSKDGKAWIGFEKETKTTREDWR